MLKFDQTLKIIVNLNKIKWLKKLYLFFLFLFAMTTVLKINKTKFTKTPNEYENGKYKNKDRFRI